MGNEPIRKLDQSRWEKFLAANETESERFFPRDVLTDGSLRIGCFRTPLVDRQPMGNDERFRNTYLVSVFGNTDH